MVPPPTVSICSTSFPCSQLYRGVSIQYLDPFFLADTKGALDYLAARQPWLSYFTPSVLIIRQDALGDMWIHISVTLRTVYTVVWPSDPGKWAALLTHEAAHQHQYDRGWPYLGCYGEVGAYNVEQAFRDLYGLVAQTLTLPPGC